MGTSVCGGSAIAAVAPTIKACDEEFSFAIQSGIDVTRGISNTAFGLTLLSLTGSGLGTNLVKIRQIGINAIMVSLVTFVGAAAGSIVLISLVAG